MRLGLIGLGRIGAFHAGNLTTLPAVDSLVVTDIVPGLPQQIADRYGAEPADTLDDLLAAGVDGVIVAASTTAHLDVVQATLKAGLPTFCEKPVAGTAAEGLEMLRLAQQSEVPVQIGFQRRFDAGMVAAREAVAGGHLGWLHTVRSTTLDPGPPPEAYIAASGGMFRDCGVHDFDIIRWVTGQEVVEVYAVGQTGRGDDYFAKHGDVDTSAAILTLDGGTLAVVSNSRYNPRGYDVRLEVHGSRDSVAVGLEDKLPLRSVEPGSTFPAGEPHRFFMDRFLPAFRAEFEAFTDVVAGNSPSPCTVAEALEADWVAEACSLSRKQHRPVRMDEVRP
jgi:myo-inositol 2-dehydrogenase/D-chiro-inositol 1-dehydrogenase